MEGQQNAALERAARFEALALTLRADVELPAVAGDAGLIDLDDWTVERWPGALHSFTLRPKPSSAVPAGLAWEIGHTLAADPRVVDAEPLFAAEIVPDSPEAERAAYRSGGALCPEDPDLPATAAPGWHLDLTDWQRAVTLHFAGDLTLVGKDVVVGHPDTGYTTHPQLGGRLDTVRARSFLTDEPDGRGIDPVDPTVQPSNPGHGTGTGSVIVSPHAGEGGGPTDVLGAAPGATLMPLRVTRWVALMSQDALSSALVYAADAGAHVVSISLGGLAARRLHEAVAYAIARGVIIVAAAGNCVRLVVYPAAYDEVTCLAACNVRLRPWRNSSRGRAVTVTAPGESVWRARATRSGDGPLNFFTERGSGTSFATATTAGIAAMWLARHGVETLRSRFPGAALPRAFKTAVRASAVGVATLPKDKFGAGLVNASALMALDLEIIATEMSRQPQVASGFRGAEPSPNIVDDVDEHPLEQLTEVFGTASDGAFRSGGDVAPWLSPLGPESRSLPTNVQRSLEREIVFHALTVPAVYHGIGKEAAGTDRGAAPDASSRERVAAALRQGGVSHVLSQYLVGRHR